MINKYFKMIGQKMPNGKMILVAVVDDNFFDCEKLPVIFEVQNIKMAPTIYTGTYPSIRVNTDTIKDREDLLGSGIASILTNEQWYCKSSKKDDLYGIGLPTNNA